MLYSLVVEAKTNGIKAGLGSSDFHHGREVLLRT
jgi:hypothetical protein